MTVYWAQLALSGIVSTFGTVQSSVNAEEFIADKSAIEITKLQYDILIAGGKSWRIESGDLIEVPRPQRPIPESKVLAKRQVDTNAEQARMLWLTPGSGQALEYEASAIDAQRAVASADPLDPTNYPWLAAEQEAQTAVGSEKTLREVAEATLAVRDVWNSAGAKIKALRREAKLRIEQATDNDEIAAIVSAVIWPKP